MKTLFALLEAMRPKQWPKNGLLFAALVFSRHLFEVDYLLKTLLAVAVFCVLSSCGYLFNDLLDIEADRGHPKKRNRPLASGRLPASVAIAFIVVGTIAALATGFAMSTGFGLTAVAYLTLTYSYTFYFKHLVILDVMGIAAGFILRAVAGATAIEVAISPWFLTCTAFASLFLAMNKRLAELLLLEKSAAKHRKNLEEYSPELLNNMINSVLAGTIMSYALYTFDVGGHPEKPRWMMLTIPIVLYAFFRYQYLVHRRGEGGAPETVLLNDRPIQLSILLYGAVVVAVLQFGN
jgi:4-hydroxybenzoate polyprenyltransferase